MSAGLETNRNNSFDFETNAATRFRALSRLFDPSTERHLLTRGLAPGWHCLEVGAGGGSIAHWLSARAGPTGRVVATDIDTRFLQGSRRPNLDIWRHDITCDPLPEGAFDLIHTRMTLIHIPERDQVLKRLAGALKPGGWLVAEEFDALSFCSDPKVSPGEVALKTHLAFQQLNQDRGVDGRYGRLLLARFRALALDESEAVGSMVMVQSGTPAASLLQASYELRRTVMVEAGYLSEVEFESDLERLADPGFMMPSPILWTAWGKKCGKE
jgi:2-polyprenyl-3-methyl-5-hydroxy-6-metoxy-1,4-benzoquinol methylase